jgi:hypothetical protein
MKRLLTTLGVLALAVGCTPAAEITDPTVSIPVTVADDVTAALQTDTDGAVTELINVQVTLSGSCVKLDEETKPRSPITKSGETDAPGTINIGPLCEGDFNASCGVESNVEEKSYELDACPDIVSVGETGTVELEVMVQFPLDGSGYVPPVITVDLPKATKDANDAADVLVGAADDDEDLGIVGDINAMAQSIVNGDSTCGTNSDELCVKAHLDGLLSQLDGLQDACTTAAKAATDAVNLVFEHSLKVCDSDDEDDVANEACTAESTEIVDCLAAAQRCLDANSASDLAERTATDTVQAYLDYLATLGEFVPFVYHDASVAIAGASVTATYDSDVRTCITESDGQCSMLLEPNTPYTFTIQAAGYQDYQAAVPVTVETGGAVTRNVQMAPQGNAGQFVEQDDLYDVPVGTVLPIVILCYQSDGSAGACSNLTLTLDGAPFSASTYTVEVGCHTFNASNGIDTMDFDVCGV